MSATRSSARLSKDRYKVVCGTVDCGARFAELGSFQTRIRPDLARREGVPPGVEVAPVLHVPPGWDRDSRDGVWRMSQRAWRRLSQGGPPAVRRAPRPEYKQFRWYWPGSSTNASMIYVKAGLSTLFECPACRRTQVVDADVLGISEIVLERERRIFGEFAGE